MDPLRAEFELLLARDDTEFSAFDCTLDGRILFLGDNEGNFEMVDTREKADRSNSVNLHDRKLNTLHVSCNLRLSKSHARSQCTNTYWAVQAVLSCTECPPRELSLLHLSCYIGTSPQDCLQYTLLDRARAVCVSVLSCYSEPTWEVRCVWTAAGAL